MGSATLQTSGTQEISWEGPEQTPDPFPFLQNVFNLAGIRGYGQPFSRQVNGIPYCAYLVISWIAIRITLGVLCLTQSPQHVFIIFFSLSGNASNLLKFLN